MRPGKITTVMPAFNEGGRLETFLKDWATEGLRHPSPIATAIIVDDGSEPQEEKAQWAATELANEMLAWRDSPHRIKYVRAPWNQGKGAAIRRGWGEADPDSDWLSFIDSDGAVPATEYWRLATALASTPADVLCGSRQRIEGRSVSRSVFRLIQGRTFAAGVERLFHLGLYDTQCGIKFFRASRLRPRLANLREDRWLLDIEVLSWLKADGARLMEVPIDCHERGGSSLSGLDPFKMAIRLVQLRSRLRREIPRIS